MWVGTKHSLAATIIHGQTVMTDFVLPHQPTATIFQGQLERRGNRVWIVPTQATVVVGHSAIRERDMQFMRETCSGLGAVSTGFAKCGVMTSVHNDSSQAFCKWLSDHGKKVVHGDINDVQVIQQMAQSPGMFMSAGVSCQPFSYLGDMKQQYDDRSRSLPGTLRASFLLQSPVILLECTPGAEKSDWVQHLLQSFASQIGFRINQKVLELHTFWVSRRTRWWCTLSHAALGIGEIPTIPKLQFCPSFLHLFPKMMDVSESDLQEISLDLYQLRYFHGYPSLHKHLLDPMKALPTATHSWGSQVKSCSCGCRKGGFSLARLEEKGLYGVITPTGGEVQCGTNLYCKCRHLHACEIALANGLHPSHVGGTKGLCRLEMAGIGQMASPFQWAWVLANVLKDIHLNAFPLNNFQEPMDVLQTMAIELLRARDQLLGFPKHSPSNEIFHQAIQQWGQSIPVPAQVPCQSTPRVDEASEQSQPEAKHPSKPHEASEAGIGNPIDATVHVNARGHKTLIDASGCTEPIAQIQTFGPKAQKLHASEAGVASDLSSVHRSMASTTAIVMLPGNMHAASEAGLGQASEASVHVSVHSLQTAAEASVCTDHAAQSPTVHPQTTSGPSPEGGMPVPKCTESAKRCHQDVTAKSESQRNKGEIPMQPNQWPMTSYESSRMIPTEATAMHDPASTTATANTDPKLGEHFQQANHLQARPLPRPGCGGLSQKTGPTKGPDRKIQPKPSVCKLPMKPALGDETNNAAVPTQALSLVGPAEASASDLTNSKAGSLVTVKPTCIVQPEDLKGTDKSGQNDVINSPRDHQQWHTDKGLESQVQPHMIMPHPCNPYAIPLPRLGCEGPSQINDMKHGNGENKNPPSSTISLRDMATTQNHLGQARSQDDPEARTHGCTTAFEGSDQVQRLREAKVPWPSTPPPPPHAKPLPRLGCGGPSQDHETEEGQRTKTDGEGQSVDPILQMKLPAAKPDQQVTHDEGDKPQHPSCNPFAKPFHA